MDLVGHYSCHLVRDAVTLVAHDNDTIGREIGVVDVSPFEKSAIDIDATATRIGKTLRQVKIMYAHARNGTHRSLYHLGTETVGSCGRADDVVDAKPVAKADDSAEIAWVLDAVESQGQRVGSRDERRGLWDIEHRQHILGSLHETDLLHLVARHHETLLGEGVGIVVLLPPLGSSHQPVTAHCRQVIFNEFVALGNEFSLRLSELSLLKTMYLFDDVFRNHKAKLGRIIENYNNEDIKVHFFGIFWTP